jgi:hypothetical protein
VVDGDQIVDVVPGRVLSSSVAKVCLETFVFLSSHLHTQLSLANETRKNLSMNFLKILHNDFLYVCL